MPDRETRLAGFTPEQVRILVAFANNAAAGRRALCVLARICAGVGAMAIAIASFAYYVLGIWRGLGHSGTFWKQ